MNDFETIRDYVVWVDKATPSKADAHAALDRLETELRETEARNEGLRQNVDRLEAEVKRLRAALEDMLGDDDIDPYVFEHMSDMERYVRNALADQPSGKP
jgi:multidrug resistance efflux pump